jgi:branched-chain amino acid aminotransferase
VTHNRSYAFFQGDIVPLEDARISVMTHAFNYGTGIFEGIRGYWNPAREEVYVLKLREHFLRFLKNARLMCIGVPYGVEELCNTALTITSMSGFREDVYIRPLAYKSSPQIGVSMNGVADDLTMFVAPFGNYVDIDRGLAVCVSSWRRTSDNAIPPRAKVTGNYVNAALVKNEALLNGYDEAITLTEEGFVSEGSAENLFIVRDGHLVTPSVADNILEGITRQAIIEIAERELGVKTVIRRVSRSELYTADEIFMTGTGAQVAPVTSVDRRPLGNGDIGPISHSLQTIYFDVVRGRRPEYMHWLTPVYASRTATVHT